ncbi:tRNA-dependent cyclodipeptide synthase [Staphylococcus equorum]|uniref:tRNA-dependent cyclodipeptide synthase n=1 Tax=Staphylococcus equorum TaxID=246432 RepID=UPI00210A8259|nr:tRNA-dependent cyclodipeptide synthase [Staphylococcus equorum]
MDSVIKEFEVEFLTSNCEAIYTSGEHITIGISPFTSKYNRDYINKVIKWANDNFSNMTILLAGKESTNILECLGTPEVKAKRKVRKELNRQKRFCEEALMSVGNYACEIYTFSDFQNDENYQEVFEQVCNNYLNDLDFKNNCLKMSKQALESKAKNMGISVENITHSDLEHASQYVLAELPFFLKSNSIFNVRKTILAYHDNWDLGEQIQNGHFDLSIDQNQGYVILNEMGE